jgi:ribosomal protein S12 methylthiotransferase accessory factor
LDITTDIGIPAMVAIGKHKQNSGYIMGMGCHLKPELAAQRALTELCQLIPIRDQNGAPFDFDAIVSGAHLYPATEDNPTISYDHCQDKDIKGQVEHIVKALQQLDFDTLVLNYSRAHIPLKTAKVFVPGLAHIWPQLDNQRLYQTPVKLGLLTQVNDEHSINPQALYI